MNRYESDRASNSGSGRYYRDQQDYGENNHENNGQRRSTNYPIRNGHRGRRGYGSAGNSYRGGTQSDAGTGGKNQFKFRLLFESFSSSHSQTKRANVEIIIMFPI